MIVVWNGELDDAQIVNRTCSELRAHCANLNCGLLACIDDLHQQSGAVCVLGAVHPTFASFTGLPAKNDYKRICTNPLCSDANMDDDEPSCCIGDVHETLFTVDKEGNILLPVNWKRILPDAGGDPVPRLLSSSSTSRHSTVRARRSSCRAGLSPLLTARGRTPRSDLRAAKRSLGEPGGDRAVRVGRRRLHGIAVCPAQLVVSYLRRRRSKRRSMRGRSRLPRRCRRVPRPSPVHRHGDVCNGDDECGANSECGEGIFEFRDRFFEDVGPVVLDQTDGVKSRIERSPGFYDLASGNAAPLGGLFQNSVMSALVIDESIEAASCATPVGCPLNINEDGDLTDSVLTVRNRVTGAPILLNGAKGIAVKIVTVSVLNDSQQASNHHFAAVAIEGDVLAFIQDNGNLRVFRLVPNLSDPNVREANEVSAAAQAVADDGLLNGSKPLVVSDGLVFVRREVPNEDHLAVLDALATPPQTLSVIQTWVDASSGEISVAGGSVAYLSAGGDVTLAKASDIRSNPATAGVDLGKFASVVALGGSCSTVGGRGPSCRTNDECAAPSTCIPSFVGAAAYETVVGNLNGDFDTGDEILQLRKADLSSGWQTPMSGGKGQAARRSESRALSWPSSCRRSSKGASRATPTRATLRSTSMMRIRTPWAGRTTVRGRCRSTTSWSGTEL
jgi:hypothetical protein